MWTLGQDQPVIPGVPFYPLSDGHSTLGRRITRACFRTCSARPPRSQAGLHSCALGTVADRPEPTLARLRYSLGGDRPIKLPAWHGPRPRSRSAALRPPERRGQYSKGGSAEAGAPVSKPPAYPLRAEPTAMPSCSEGSRGLSVLPQVIRIFTNSAISPGPWSRQRPSRYAVRAGRNLPDKEFRYLRTVIVTAAVYRGLASALRSSANASA